MMRIDSMKHHASRWVHAGLSAVLILTAWASVSHGAQGNSSRQKNVSVSVDYYVDWGSGACGEGLVTNHGSRRIRWEVCLDLPGLVTTNWNSNMTEGPNSDCPQNGAGYSWKFVGVDWNRRLRPGASTTFGFCIDWTQAPEPIELPEEPVEEDPIDPAVEDEGLTLVAATTSVSLLVDPATGLAYVQDQGSEPILITRDDSYWAGDMPLTRGGATIMAAARDDQGRLRVLDGGGLDVWAWILDETGLFIGEESPSDTSIADKEALFQIDIDGDGQFGQTGQTSPPAEPEDPATPPMDDHDHDDHMDPPVESEDPANPPMEDHDHHDHMPPPANSGDYIDITTWGTFHGSNHNSEHDELVGGRTAITTEAHEAYNNLRAFLGLSPATIEEVGEWAFAESLTNNSQAWGNDLLGVGLFYALQGAKVGWITDEAYDPQILADIQRTARTVADQSQMRSTVMAMVRDYGHPGYADYLEQYGLVDTFINTLKMEPHYGGWMHGRTHGFRSIEGVAINHDVNHLTVLSWDQMQPFMNDTFDWPQWDALDVSDSGVIEYFQSMVALGNPVGQNL